MTMPQMTDCGAMLSVDGRYRYLLWRGWGEIMPVGSGVLWIMLNPSTADESADDPTIRRCIDFSRQWGFENMQVVNLFAYRSTDPGQLPKVFDPIGPENDRVIAEAAATAPKVVCAWGTRGSLYRRGPRVLTMLRRAGVKPWCLGVTKSGAPNHPLYLAASTPLVEFGR